MIKGRYHILAGSFLVAALFWFSVTMGGSFRARFDIPVVVSKMPNDLALADPLPETIDVLLEARGWQLLFLEAGKQIVYEIPGAHLRSGVIQTNRALAESMKLPDGVRAIRAYPETLVIRVDRFIRKKVPVRFTDLNVSFKEGFGLMKNIEITPDSIYVEGAQSVLRNIDAWPIEARSYVDLALPVVEDIPLLDSLGGIVSTSVDKVSLYIPTDQMADMSFDEIPVTVRNVPDDRQVLLGVTSISISVRGGVNYLATLSADEFSADVEFSDIVADTSGSIIPTIHFPAGLQLLSIEPNEIRYTIRR